MKRYARYEVFTVMKIQDMVFWVVTPGSDVVGYKHLGRPCCSYHPKEKGSKVLCNVGIVPHHYMALLPRRP
jgi:hypothetical protein